VQSAFPVVRSTARDQQSGLPETGRRGGPLTASHPECNGHKKHKKTQKRSRKSWSWKCSPCPRSFVFLLFVSFCVFCGYSLVRCVFCGHSFLRRAGLMLWG